MTDFKLIHGIYESVINHALEERLSRLEENYAVTKNQLDSEESSFTLALHLTKLIANSLAGIKGDDRKQKQAQFCNQLLEVIGQNDTSFPVESEKIVEDLMYLMQIQDTRKKPLSRPDTPLTNAALFTGTASDLTLESELKKEIQTADRIDLYWHCIHDIFQSINACKHRFHFCGGGVDRTNTEIIRTLLIRFQCL